MDVSYFTYVAGLSALAVVGIQEILKLKIVPNGFANKYPVVTNILLSAVASVIVVWQTALQPTIWTQWIALIATISIVAAITYNQLIGRSPELKSLEGEGTKK